MSEWKDKPDSDGHWWVVHKGIVHMMLALSKDDPILKGEKFLAFYLPGVEDIYSPEELDGPWMRAALPETPAR